MESFFPHVTEAQANDPWRRVGEHDAVRKIRIFTHNDKFFAAGVIPNFRIARAIAQILGMADRQAGRKRQASRRVLVEQKPSQATSCRRKWFFISSDERDKQARTSCRVRDGYSSRTSSTESPAARNSRTVWAVTRVPRIVGWPLHISGSKIILFIVLMVSEICWSAMHVGQSKGAVLAY